jgi:hypothetical protein
MNKEEQKEKQEKLQQIAVKKYEAYKEFFRSENGEQILMDLMKACHFTDSVIGQTPEQTYFNEGQRCVVLQIIRTAQLTPNDISRLTTKIKEEDEQFY